MADRELTPHELVLQAAARRALNDPALQRQFRMAVDRLAEYNATITRATAAAAGSLSRALQPLMEATHRIVQDIDLDGVRSALRFLGEAFMRLLPPNARSLGAEYWPTLERLGADEQLCLSWVPDVSTARALCDASDAGERELLLVDSAVDVLDACRSALAEVRNTLETSGIGEDVWPSQLLEVTGLMEACVDTAARGDFAAAQALAICCCDTVMTQYIAGARARKAHGFVKSKLVSMQEQQFAAIVLAPVLAALDSTMSQPSSWGGPQGGTRSPLSRQATVHAASATAFTEVTALKAVILSTSLLKAAISPLLYWLLEERPELAQPDV